ncbi:MAG: Mut7-C RNAse domain-containing protein [Methanomassiliicoccales archaeon]
MLAEPKFLADGMLGSLARWLRMMGYDTTYYSVLEDDELLKMAKEQGRLLLTRDQDLAARGGRYAILITEENLEEQLLQLVHELGLRTDLEMSRCTECNGALESVSKEEVKGRVPQRTLQLQDQFHRCLSCGKIYWKGTHWANIQRRIAGIEARSDRNPR